MAERPINHKNVILERSRNLQVHATLLLCSKHVLVQRVDCMQHVGVNCSKASRFPLFVRD